VILSQSVQVDGRGFGLGLVVVGEYVLPRTRIRSRGWKRDFSRTSLWIEFERSLGLNRILSILGGPNC